MKQQKEEQSKTENSYFPPYFNELLSRVEILRSNNHQVPEKYTLPKLFKLSNICEKVRRNNILEQHMLDSTFQSMVNSDKDSIKKKQKYYNNLINRFRE